MEILKGTLKSDDSRDSRRWQSRMRGCLVVLIVPTLVALSLAALRPQAGIHSLQMTNANNAAVSPDGQLLAVATGSLKHVWIGKNYMSGYDKIDLISTSTLNLLRSIQTPLTQRITFHPDNQMLVALGVDGIIRLYRLADGVELGTFEGHASSRRGVIFSPDGQLIASNGPGKMIQLWRVSDGKVIKMLPSQANVDSVAFSPDGQLLAADEDAGDVVLWQIGDGREIRRFKELNVNALSFSPDGSFLAIGTSDTGPGTWHGEVHIWDIKTNDTQPRWNFYHQDFVGAIVFDASGRYIAAGGHFATRGSGLLGDGDFWPARKIVIWRMSDGQRIQTIRTPHKEIYNLFFSPDGNTLISTGVDRNFEGNLAIWRVLPLSSWWDWLLPGSFVAALAVQMLWKWSRRRRFAGVKAVC